MNVFEVDLDIGGDDETTPAATTTLATTTPAATTTLATTTPAATTTSFADSQSIYYDQSG